MVYDVLGHLPQIVEEMRQDFKAENVEGLETNKMFLEKIIPSFITVFNAVEQHRDKERIKTWKNYFNTLGTIIKKNNGDFLDTIDIDDTLAVNERIKSLNQHERDYWETIISKVVQFVKEEYKKNLKEE